MYNKQSLLHSKASMIISWHEQNLRSRFFWNEPDIQEKKKVRSNFDMFTELNPIVMTDEGPHDFEYWKVWEYKGSGCLITPSFFPSFLPFFLPPPPLSLSLYPIIDHWQDKAKLTGDKIRQ